MIERYSRPEMARIWAPESRIRRMIEVEIAFLEALADEKRIPAREIRALKAVPVEGLAEKVRVKEEKSAHDVVALIQTLAEALRGRAPRVERYLHYGLTSSDVLDTALALQMREAGLLLLEGWRKVERPLRRLARAHEDSWMAGRTHGVHAEPTTFGLKLAGWHSELRRNEERLRSAVRHASFGKVSGAVGTFAHFAPSVESAVCRRLGLSAEPISTQVVPRDRHADYFHALVLSAGAIERFATELRHLQRTEVLETEEPFGSGQKGSSAMPHKRNPVLCENLCGLARLIRGYETAMLENLALWHERDISHSSVERVALPDATVLLDFMLDRFARLLDGLRVDARRMRENLDSSMGLVFSQKILLSLVDRGLGRLEAYDIVQRCAMETWRSRRPFRDILAEDPEVSRRMRPAELDACFDLASYRRPVRALMRREGLA